MDLASAQRILASAGIQIDAGLSDQEVVEIEAKFAFQFPPDLRNFLSIGLPVSHRWLDWRSADAEVIQERFDWPFDSMCFDIKHDAFWLEEWGAKPAEHEAAIEIARRGYEQAPRLIPICSHRYMPALPHEEGNPVFSVYQTDIIYYGSDLIDYLQNEYRFYFGRPAHLISGTPKRISFWSMLAES
jgi:hypothetical protein